MFAPRRLVLATCFLVLASSAAAQRRSSAAPAVPAALFGIPQRGTLIEGHVADLVLFDPSTVAGPASYDAPTTPPTGIRMVLLNGRRIVPV